MLRSPSTAALVFNISRRFMGRKSDLGSIVNFVNETERLAKQPGIPRQHFSNFLIVDFEATCNRGGPKPNPQEIIEFPVLNLDGTTLKEVSRFHSYVRPDVHPVLSDFCSELTGVIQEMVDEQPNLKTVLANFEKWLEENNLNEINTVPIIFGDWDIGSALRSQCNYLGIAVPPVFHKWVNLKHPLFHQTNSWPRGLLHCLQVAELPIHGRLHSGIDDCVNIASLVRYLGEQGHVFTPTAKLKNQQSGASLK